jgi:hypothetical protein
MTAKNKVRMLVLNESDKATLSLSTGTEVATLPLSHVQKYNNSRTFRTLDFNQVAICGEFTTLTLLSGLVIWRHNLSNTATMRLELFDGDNQTGSKIFDSNEINAIPQISVADWDWRVQPVVASIFDGWPTRYSQLWLTPAFAKSFRLTIKDPNNTDNYIDITRIYMGRHFEPDVNFDYGHNHNWQSAEQHQRTDDGSLFTQESAEWREQSLTLNHLSNADRPHFTNAVRHVGKSKDWFISMFPESGGQKEVEYAFACKFTERPSVSGSAFDQYQSQINVEEC